MATIPFNRPAFVGKELHYIAQTIHNRHASGNGPFTTACQRLLERAIGVPKVLLTTSCTDALEIAALLLDFKPGDEFIVPSFTFVTTANAFVLHGGTPVFADVRRDTLTLDAASVERLVTPRTKAIVPVHYGGIGCDMDALCRIAARHGITVVEDNAHGLFGRYNGRQLGTFGALATLSFHETKNFSCGEGGALLLNDQRYVERAEIIWEKGTNRSRFFRGEVDKYTWVDVGSSHLPSDILAAFLLAQLEARDTIQARRRQIWTRYYEALSRWADAQDVTLPTVPEHCEQSYHLFYLVMPTPEDQSALIDHLRHQGIQAVFHYLPLHLSPMGRRFNGQLAHCPVTQSVSEQLVRLPFFNDMTVAEQERVVESVTSFRTRRRSRPAHALSEHSSTTAAAAESGSNASLPTGAGLSLR
jgi:dTDP-4-amino-4,6-dideoxygalactose transaminase